MHVVGRVCLRVDVGFCEPSREPVEAGGYELWDATSTVGCMIFLSLPVPQEGACEVTTAGVLLRVHEEIVWFC